MENFLTVYQKSAREEKRQPIQKDECKLIYESVHTNAFHRGVETTFCWYVEDHPFYTVNLGKVHWDVSTIDKLVEEAMSLVLIHKPLADSFGVISCAPAQRYQLAADILLLSAENMLALDNKGEGQ